MLLSTICLKLNHLELKMRRRRCNLLHVANDCSYLLAMEWSGAKKMVDKPIEFSIPILKILNLKYLKGMKIEELVEQMKKHGAALEKIVVWERNDAVRTSIISRKWQSEKLWRLLPSLNFDSTEFLEDSCTKKVKFIDETLKNRSHYPIQKFRFSLDWFPCDGNEHDTWDHIESKLDDWISYAISHKATDLDVEINPNDKYNFNLDLLNNCCIWYVRFYGGNLRCALPSLNLDSIRTVFLEEITFTDDMIADLISWSNNLESLALEFCYGMDNLKIFSTTLKKLSLVNIEGSSLNICCPNLSSILIFNSMMEEYCIKASASLEAELYFDGDHEWPSNLIRELIGVKGLILEDIWFQYFCEEDAPFYGCVFENLNHLEVRTSWGHSAFHGVAALLKICPNITTLTLDFCLYNNFDYEYESMDKSIVEFNIPNLKILNLKTTEDAEIDEWVDLMEKQGTALEKIIVWEHNDYISRRYKVNPHTKEWHQDLE